MKRTPFLQKIAAWSVGHPGPVLWLALVAVVLSIPLAAAGLELKTSNLDLIDEDLPQVRDFTRFAEEFGTPNVLVVVLEGNDRQALRTAIDRIGPLLGEVPGVKRVGDRLPFDDDLLREWDLDRHLFSDDGKMLFAFVQPVDPHSSAETIAPFVEGVREVLERSDLDALGVRAGLTGMPQYALDDRDVIRRDISLLSLVSLALVLLLFASAFRSMSRPLLAVVALLVAVLLTLAVATVYPGHLTLLSAFFAMVLFGLGVDYGIHIINCVEERMAAGEAERKAVPAAVAALSPGLTTGAWTTALIFLSLTLCGFKGFAELGWIAGTGVLLCLLTMTSVLPALLVVVPHRPRSKSHAFSSLLGRSLCAVQHRYVALALGTAALLAVFIGGPGFDTNYLNLQPAQSDAVRLERAMVDRSDFSPAFAVFTVDSTDAAAELSDRLLADETVADVQSIADMELLLEGRDTTLPAEFLSAFRSPGGRFAVYAYPAGDVWDPQAQQLFLRHMRALDEHVTGMPVLGRFMVDRSRRAMTVTAALGALILTVCVLIGFRAALPAVLAALPTLLTVTSMGALMRAWNIPYNPLNVMALPVVLGIAIDDGVHIVHRFLADGGDLGRTLAGTGRSVILTSATTIAAFGSLAFTVHRGLRSFALAVSIGVTTALLLSVLMLPGLLVLTRGRLLRRQTGPLERAGLWVEPCGGGSPR